MAKLKRVATRVEWQDACMLMHTALRKTCDSKITNAVYNLVHLMRDTSIWGAWRILGELVVKYLNEGKRPADALAYAVANLEKAFHGRSTTARFKGEEEPDDARLWLYALNSTLQCLSPAEIECMAVYLEDA